MESTRHSRHSGIAAVDSARTLPSIQFFKEKLINKTIRSHHVLDLLRSARRDRDQDSWRLRFDVRPPFTGNNLSPPARCMARQHSCLDSCRLVWWFRACWEMGSGLAEVILAITRGELWRRGIVGWWRLRGEFVEWERRWRGVSQHGSQALKASLKNKYTLSRGLYFYSVHIPQTPSVVEARGKIYLSTACHPLRGKIKWRFKYKWGGPKMDLDTATPIFKTSIGLVSGLRILYFNPWSPLNLFNTSA